MIDENYVKVNRDLADAYKHTAKQLNCIVNMPLKEMHRIDQHYLLFCNVLRNQHPPESANDGNAYGFTRDVIHDTVFYNEAQLSKQSSETLSVITNRLKEMEFPSEQVQEVKSLLALIFTLRLRGLTNTFQIYLRRRGQNERNINTLTGQEAFHEIYHYLIIESRPHNPKPSPWESTVFPFEFRSSTVVLSPY